ncbi:serpin peptidase inhibitor, clade B (ovalbumin), member 1, like 3 [Spinachia spinachia]
METSTSSKASKANTTFSLALLKKLRDDGKTANVFYSPFSLSSALAMVMLGAKGNTAKQMSEALCFTEVEEPKQVEEQLMPTETQTQTESQTQTPIKSLMQSQMQSQMQTRRQLRTQIQQRSRLPQYLVKCLKPEDDEDDVHASFSKLLSELNKMDAPFALSLANRLYGEQTYTFVEDYLSQTKKHYKAELESVDFQTKADDSRVLINSWVEKQTQGKIQDLLGEGVVNASTMLVLVNAIYFKGNWDKKFNEASTVDADFRINKKDTKSVKMMSQTSKFSFTSIPEANFKIVELLYKGKELSMLIFLPDEIEDDTTGLEMLEKELTYEKFVEWTRPDKMAQTETEVRLPRFKMEESYHLKNALISMGMEDAFTNSDFSGMSPASTLVLSQVIHKAFVEVNEEGTEAAASTAAVMSNCDITPETFIANHPFLFFIRHNPTRTILFNGRYCSPERTNRLPAVSSDQRFVRLPKTMASPTPLSKANTTFSLALLKKFGDNDKTANVFYSPFSISSALAMVMLGAKGNTAKEMSEVLGFTAAQEPRHTGAEQMQMQMQMQQHVAFKLPPHLQKRAAEPAAKKCLETEGCQDDVHVSFSHLLSELNKADAPYALNVANRLYGEKSYVFVKDYLGSTEKHYSAKLEPVDFVNSSAAARLNINKWVHEQTQGKIKDLLAEDLLDESTRLVLVNAIYFKGNWNKKFQESATRDVKFRINKNETKSVKMMHQKSKFPFTYIPEANCQILEMPYKGKELSMLIFLPSEIEDSTTGLEKLEEALTYDNFVEWTRPDMMDEVEVQVGLPRFKMEENYDMKNVLVSMGMVDAFDPSMCDFSGMAPGNDLVLSKVVHKAFVEVNEEGTEAAAATAAIMMLRMSMLPASFIADHPFLFFIRHNPSMSILFAGRYSSPK